MNYCIFNNCRDILTAYFRAVFWKTRPIVHSPLLLPVQGTGEVRMATPTDFFLCFFNLLGKQAVITSIVGSS